VESLHAGRSNLATPLTEVPHCGPGTKHPVGDAWDEVPQRLKRAVKSLYKS